MLASAFRGGFQRLDAGSEVRGAESAPPGRILKETMRFPAGIAPPSSRNHHVLPPGRALGLCFTRRSLHSQKRRDDPHPEGCWQDFAATFGRHLEQGPPSQPGSALAVALPYSVRFWAQGFSDLRRRSWQEGQARAFEEYAGVTRALVPDNAATVTN